MLQMPYLLGLLLPVGMYLAVLLVFSRMYVDHEMTICKACGLSRWQILWMIVPSCVVVTLLVAAMTLGLNPQLLAIQTQLLQESPTKLLVDTLMPGRFHVAGDGKQVYYVESIERETDTAKQVFVAKRTASKGQDGKTAAIWSVLSAESGNREQDEQGIDYIITKQGYRYLGQPGQAKFQWVQFATLSTFLDTVSAPPLHLTQAGMSNPALWQARKTDLHAEAELQWRLAVPLSVPVLALLAVPLSYVRPRQGRYGPLLPAILVYIVFANFMFVSRSWLESGQLAPELGLWWILVAAFSLGLILQMNGWRYFSWRGSRNKQLQVTG